MLRLGATNVSMDADICVAGCRHFEQGLHWHRGGMRTAPARFLRHRPQPPRFDQCLAFLKREWRIDPPHGERPAPWIAYLPKHGRQVINARDAVEDYEKGLYLSSGGYLSCKEIPGNKTIPLRRQRPPDTPLCCRQMREMTAAFRIASITFLQCKDKPKIPAPPYQ
jgi:hypothetical protein